MKSEQGTWSNDLATYHVRYPVRDRICVPTIWADHCALLYMYLARPRQVCDLKIERTLVTSKST